MEIFSGKRTINLEITVLSTGWNSNWTVLSGHLVVKILSGGQRYIDYRNLKMYTSWSFKIHVQLENSDIHRGLDNQIFTSIYSYLRHVSYLSLLPLIFPGHRTCYIEALVNMCWLK